MNGNLFSIIFQVIELNRNLFEISFQSIAIRSIADPSLQPYWLESTLESIQRTTNNWILIEMSKHNFKTMKWKYGTILGKHKWFSLT